MKLVCIDCFETFEPTMRYSCSECNGILEVVKDSDDKHGETLSKRIDSMWKYYSKLAVTDPKNIVSLQEGNTPLIKSENLPNELPGFKGSIYIKDETMNPTGSFKDRLISAGISKAKELGYKKIVCSSSGNAGASASAYAAKAGMEAIILAPKSTPHEKMTQISSYGAKVVLVEGNYSNSYNLAQKLSEEFDCVNLTTTFLNPFGTDALKTVAYELDEQLQGEIPDYIFIPVGSGPLLKGLFQGYEELNKEYSSFNKKRPKLVAVQAEGCAPIVVAFDNNEEKVTAWGEPKTIASGISDPLRGYEKDGTYTLKLVRETNGMAISVTDQEIRDAMKSLATREAVFAEPTGASSYAAIKKMWKNNILNANDKVVCMVTGHGFKDMKVYYEMIDNVKVFNDPKDYKGICKVLSTNESSISN